MSAAAAWQAILLAMTPGLPLVLALLVLSHGRLGDLALRFGPWAALPALGTVAWADGTELSSTWLLLGSRIGLDEIARAFLGFSALLWLLAGIYAKGYLAHDPRVRRFFAFFLLSMAGNLGVVIALDALTFFAFFTLMSFASYGLVVHEPTPANLRAGRVYIVLVVLGEVMVFAGIMLVTSASDNVFPLAHHDGNSLAVGLLLVGFGIKAGALPLHVWLPLAHPAAPTPASAVLSGAMIKVGLLGWLRFLPLGAVALPSWGMLAIVVGFIGAFYGVIVGLSQRDPKVVLAYSSISQMGYLTMAVGLGLLAPAHWPTVLAAIVLYATHHGLAKGALFLGVGAAAGAPRRLVFLGLAVPVLAMAGATLTSGASAKAALSGVLLLVRLPAGEWLTILLSLAALGTALLMSRFIVVLFSQNTTFHAIGAFGWISWVLLLLVVATSAFWLPGSHVVSAPEASWTVAVGGTLGLLLWRYGPRLETWPRILRVPPGDILAPTLRWGMPLLRAILAGERGVEILEERGAANAVKRARRLQTTVRVVERRLQDWRFVGIALFLSLLAVAASMVLAQ